MQGEFLHYDCLSVRHNGQTMTDQHAWVPVGACYPSREFYVWRLARSCCRSRRVARSSRGETIGRSRWRRAASLQTWRCQAARHSASDSLGSARATRLKWLNKGLGQWLHSPCPLMAQSGRSHLLSSCRLLTLSGHRDRSRLALLNGTHFSRVFL